MYRETRNTGDRRESTTDPLYIVGTYIQKTTTTTARYNPACTSHGIIVYVEKYRDRRNHQTRRVSKKCQTGSSRAGTCRSFNVGASRLTSNVVAYRTSTLIFCRGSTFQRLKYSRKYVSTLTFVRVPHWFKVNISKIPALILVLSPWQYEFEVNFV